MAKLKDTPKHDRPREKFLEKGSDALTDSELLAILLGSGIKGTNVKSLAQKISRGCNNVLSKRPTLMISFFSKVFLALRYKQTRCSFFLSRNSRV